MGNLTESKNIPELRFPGFRGAWEEKKLGEIVERVTRRNEESLVNHVLTISGEHGLIDQEEYFNKRVASKNLSNYYLIYRDEFAYNKSYSNGYPYGAIKRLKRYDEGVLSSLYICFKSHQHSDILYLENYFESDNWHKEIYKIAVEGARNHGLLNISIGDFFSSKHFIPPLPEQEKIGSFFYTLDQKLDLQKKRIEELETYKKGMMQRIFSQEIRFKDENGQDYPDWEEKRLGQISKITTGKLDANAMVDNGKYRFYTCAKEYYRIDNYAFDTEALLISGNGANVGYIHYYNGKFNAYQRTYVLDSFKEYIIYIKYFLNANLKKRIDQTKNAGNTPYITLGTLSDMRISLPSLPEQKKIASFLSNLDRRIELEEERLESYEEFKKGLMQRMFV